MSTPPTVTGRELPRTGETRGRRRLYCSPACGKRARRARLAAARAPVGSPSPLPPGAADVLAAGPPEERAADLVLAAWGIAGAMLALAPRLPPRVGWDFERVGRLLTDALAEHFTA